MPLTGPEGVPVTRIMRDSEPRPTPGRPTMAQLREFRNEQWRLGALADYCGLLVRLCERHPENASLMDRIERAITEADRTQAHLDQMTDALL
jgi:hypothetical protein